MISREFKDFTLKSHDFMQQFNLVKAAKSAATKIRVMRKMAILYQEMIEFDFDNSDEDASKDSTMLDMASNFTNLFLEVVEE